MILRLIQKLLITSFLATLTACGGGGGGDSQKQPGNVASNSSKVFSVALSDVEVRRVSNGEEVAVDITRINSGELTLSQ